MLAWEGDRVASGGAALYWVTQPYGSDKRLSSFSEAFMSEGGHQRGPAKPEQSQEDEQTERSV